MHANIRHTIRRVSNMFESMTRFAHVRAAMMIMFVLSFFFSGSIMSKAHGAIVPYKNPRLPIEKRVEDLLRRMTLEEKIDLLGGTGFATKPNERLGIPELKMTDGALGVRWGRSTAFPAGIAMAATWDTALIGKVGRAIAQEAKAKGRNVLLGPNVNIARIPLNGRTFEAFGEDPYLTSRLAVSYIKGVQSEGVVATVKHFVCNNQEYERAFVNEIVGQRALHEIYFPAFKAAVEQGHVLAVMAAYNKVNGTYCSANAYLLKTELKKRWGFKGLVMSDWGGVHRSIPTANGGLDLEMPNGKYLNDSTLIGAVKKGLVSEQTINDMVGRILYVMFKIGLFDHPTIQERGVVSDKAHREIAYETACEGAVLLKNKNDILPLKLDRIKSIALIGPSAAIARTGGGGSSHVAPTYSVSPLAAFRNRLGRKIKINYAVGASLEGDVFPIDSSFLYTPDGKEHGLLAEYFDNKELTGKPAFTSVDPEVDFNWGGGAPAKGFKKDNSSVRWTGYVKAPKTGEYVLQTLSSDGVKLYIDDKLVIDDWTDHAVWLGSGLDTCRVRLKANKKYKLKLEYYDHWGQTIIKLGWCPAGENLLADAVRTASQSDVAIVLVGTSAIFESEGRDRDNLRLPGDQDSLIKAVSKVNKHVVVVLTTGSPVSMNGWVDKVDGILEAWFGGSEAGNAIADIVLGKVDPSGKLPITFPKRWKNCSAYGSYNNPEAYARSVADLRQPKLTSGSAQAEALERKRPGMQKQDSVSVYRDGIFVGYRWFDKHDIEPLFPFGYGLSYTAFSYRDLKIDNVSRNDSLFYRVSFDLRNIGKIKGAEVAQLYVGPVESSVDMPVKQLKGFRRVSLMPGESKRIEFTLNSDAFSYYDVREGKWVVHPGKYDVMIGSSSRDIRLEVSLDLR